MVTLSFQLVQVQPISHRHTRRWSNGRRRNRSSTAIKGAIAEPGGEPAPMGQKTKYKDGSFEKAFMKLFARKMEKFAAAAPGKASKEKKNKYNGGFFEYDYESFVDVSKRVMQGRSRTQQQEVVREVLLSMLPPGAPAQTTGAAPPHRRRRPSGPVDATCRMPRTNKGFALQYDTDPSGAGSSGGGSSSGPSEPAFTAGTPVSAVPSQAAQAEGSRVEGAFRKKTLSKDHFWFHHSALSRAISSSIKSFFDGQCTCISDLPKQELQQWWAHFEGQYTWPSELSNEVYDGWYRTTGRNLRNLVNKVAKTPDDKPIKWLTDAGRARLKAQRSTPDFKKKSAQCLKNRTEGPKAGTLHSQGSLSSVDLTRRMVLEGKTPTPFLLFARSHSKGDPQYGKVFVDDRSKALWEQYETLRVERGIEEGTPEAEQLYYEVSGGWNKKHAIYGLGKAASLFYEKSTPSTTSTASTCIPSTLGYIQS